MLTPGKFSLQVTAPGLWICRVFTFDWNHKRKGTSREGHNNKVPATLAPGRSAIPN
jgi:hypothetical protein